VFPRKRLVAVLLDEAHSVLTHEYRQVLTSLRLRQQARWLPLADAPLVIGLTATPWRTRDEEVRSLRGYFSERLVGPEALGPLPVAELQRRGILAKVEARHIVHREPPTMSNRQLAQFRQFGELPGDYLEGLGADPVRNATILKRLAHLPKRSRTLVFACSIAHAEVLAMILDSYFGTDCAAVVSSRTPRAERIDVIERFRNGDGIRFLCNVGVLTTGFDAPRADSVCLTRPTASAIRYEQMVGRGLRGPKNGGTEKCTVLDVQDKGLPDSIQSYGRVLELWDRRPVRANR